MTEETQKKKIILVTEDEPAMRDALVAKLTAEGFEVFTANDGQEGLAIAETKRPDCIVLDILMPRMDGLTMMETLRQKEWGKNVPIIILTNLDPNDRMVNVIMRDHPSYYLLKANIKLEDLVEKTKEVLHIQ